VKVFPIECPCCKARLRVDPETQAVISHQIPEKPPTVEDLSQAVHKLKGEEQRREQVFRKQVEAEKLHGRVLEKKFEELFERVKADPPTKPELRDIDLD
jgi:hypothetical protein